MVRNAEDTRRRILAAATAEFAAFGIAGARVDRIADAAATSKERIYANFGNKEQLFDAVFTAYVSTSLAEVDFDADDLPAYAGRMFDQFADQPDTLRLSTWYRLERPAGIGLDAVVAANRARLKAIADAQRSGVLPGHFQPVELLALVQSVAASWARMNPEFDVAARKISRAHRRRAVVEAVRRLVA
jgi:AcrR family transcriptional regulator